MISFQSRNSAIRNADRITRHVNSVYPHISESKFRIYANEVIQNNSGNPKMCLDLSKLKFKYESKMDALRFRGGYGLEQFKIIIDNLKNHKLGNCYESAILAQIIGKINGIKNIYPAQMFFTKNSPQINMQLDHAVAVITDKPFEKDFKYQFKNKDAIIVDPWLCVTDYVGEYLSRIRNQLHKNFPFLSDNEIRMKNFAANSNNLAEFNQTRKKCFKHEFFFKLHEDEISTPEETEMLKKEFPELIFK